MERVAPDGTAAIMGQFPNWVEPDSIGVRARTGYTVLIRLGDKVVARYIWDMIPVNKSDPNCGLWVEGWRLVERNASPISADDQTVHWMSVE